DLLWRYKFADPNLLELTDEYKIVPGSIFATLQTLACHNEMRTPLIDRDELTTGTSVASTGSGDGEIFYIPYVPLQIGERATKQDWKGVVVVTRYNQDHKATDRPGVYKKFPRAAPIFRTSVSLELFNCATSQVFFGKLEAYDASRQLVDI